MFGVKARKRLDVAGQLNFNILSKLNSPPTDRGGKLIDFAVAKSSLVPIEYVQSYIRLAGKVLHVLKKHKTWSQI